MRYDISLCSHLTKVSLANENSNTNMCETCFETVTFWFKNNNPCHSARPWDESKCTKHNLIYRLTWNTVHTPNFVKCIIHSPTHSSCAILKMKLALFSKLKTCTAVIARLWILACQRPTLKNSKHYFLRLIISYCLVTHV